VFLVSLNLPFSVSVDVEAVNVLINRSYIILAGIVYYISLYWLSARLEIQVFRGIVPIVSSILSTRIAKRTGVLYW
jgi:hypothetical protein